MVCFHCGIYGHHKDLCPRLCSPEATSTTYVASVPMANDPKIPVLGNPYGPWMLVERKKRVLRNSLVTRHSSVSTRSNMETRQVFKFNPVFEANDVPHGSVPDSLSDKPVNSAPQVSTLVLLLENHTPVDVISTPIDQPILVQQITPITDDLNTKSLDGKPIQRKKATVIPKKLVVTPLGPKKTGSLGAKSSKSQMSLSNLAMYNARNIASSSFPSRAIVTKKINTQVLDPPKHHVVHH
ncbi:hypothetical protein V6N13_123796 [Hibiscus sabdariffa]